jgi:hypothetical protein
VEPVAAEALLAVEAVEEASSVAEAVEPTRSLEVLMAPVVEEARLSQQWR